jgi:hypothetical protein
MAKAALISKTAAPKPVSARGRPDAHLALRGVSHTYPARARQRRLWALLRDESKKALGVA